MFFFFICGLVYRGDVEVNFALSIGNSAIDYYIEHLFVPSGKTRSFKGASKEGVVIKLNAVRDSDAVIDASGGGDTLVSFEKMTFNYMYPEGNENYCFLKFSSTSKSLTLEDVDFSSPTAGEKKHRTSVIKVTSSCAVFRRVSFRNLRVASGSVIELSGGPLTVDGCTFSNVVSGEGNGAAIKAGVVWCVVKLCDVMWCDVVWK
jgi:hypothetical protein